MALNVIDVSDNNGTIDWNNVSADGAIIKCGYRGYATAGTLNIDSKFKENAAGAAAAGIPFGVYWISQAISDEEAEEEAEYVLDLIKDYSLSYPVYLDSEWSHEVHNGRADTISRARKTQYALTWLKAIEAAGYTAGVYACESWLYGSSRMLAVEELTDYTLWVAKYSTTKPYIGGISYDAWQYTKTGSDSGTSGNTDQSYFYRDFPAERIEAEVAALTDDEFDEYMDRWLERQQEKEGSSWSEDDREWAVSEGLFQGDENGNYMWRSSVTREQLAAVLHRQA